MNPKEWEQIKGLFSSTLDLPTGDRASFLASVDQKLRVEVEKLLSNVDRAEDFIEEPAFVQLGLNETLVDDTFAGRTIDDYLILEEIGTGGMGAVYLAEQRREDLSHRVAIKLIKRGMDTNSVLKRFVQERQILANLEHPNIARFLDGGSTDEGLPYFVMEYVEGLPINKYCEKHALDVRRRLELFRKVAAAVSFAHQNLIVHRDLKPSNILVDEYGEVKLLDFGIARLLNPDWSVSTTEATATMFRAMTPEYASPEQLRGLPVTTSGDVYSLGVVLFEILTGERPYKIESRSPEEVAREVLTQEPVKPSSVVQQSRSNGNTTKSTDRQTRDTLKAPRSHVLDPRSLHGDLDNIILKALQKEPERRYASVEEFSEDIRRHLDGLPVRATADTFSYRVNKFVKRHKAGVFASALVGLTLIAATAITARQASIANAERAKSEQRFGEIRKLTNSFMFEFHDAISDLPGSTAARSLVVKKALEYLEILASENLTDPDLRYELATAYIKVADLQGKNSETNLGDTKGALENYQKARDILDTLLAADPENVQYMRSLASTLVEMTSIFAQRGDIEDFLASNRRSVEVFEKVISIAPDDNQSKATLSDSYKSLGDYISSTGDLAGSLEQYQKAARLTQTVLDKDPADAYAVGRKLVADEAIAATLGNPNYTNLGDKEGSLLAYRNLTETARTRLENKPTDAQLKGSYGYLLQNLGLVLASMGQWPEAVENHQRAFAVQNELVESDKDNWVARWRFANILTDLGQALAETGKIEAALDHHRRSIEILESAVERDRENSSLVAFRARAYQRYGDTLVKAKRFEAATESYEKAIASDEEMANADAANMDIRWALAEDYAKIGRFNLLMSSIPGSKQRHYLEEARRRFNQSCDVYVVMQQHGLNIKPITDSIEALGKEIRTIDELLAKS